MKPPAKAGSRDRVLSDDELKTIWTNAITVGYAFGPIVQILMLTAQRRGEVAAMQWSDIDTGKAVWTIPAERTKNQEEFLRDEEAYCRKFNLNDEQRQAVKNRNILALVEAGGNINYVAKFAGIFGWNVQDIGAQQTGMTVDEFKAKLLRERN